MNSRVCVRSRDSLLPVVEETKGEHDAHQHVSDVAGAGQQQASRLHHPPDLAKALFRSVQMFDEVEGHYGICLSAQGFGGLFREVPVEVQLEVWEGQVHIGLMQVYGHHVRTLLMKGPCHPAVPGAQFKDFRAGLPATRQHVLVDGGGRCLEDVPAVVEDVELRMVDQVDPVREGLNNPILGGTRSVAVRRSGYEGLSER